ncbi:MAG: hypothetical protein O7E49_13620 [Gemmatimonadetes bacterium]|nr:hypothetical protein [Gemmatimonadota bacterium]
MSSHFPLRAACILGSAVLLGADTAVAQIQTNDGLPPAGYGRLNQDNLSIGMRTSSLDIRLTILQESALRLLNQDSYASLHRLVESKRVQIDSIAELYSVPQPGLLMVRYFALVEGTRFDAQLLTANVNTLFLNPVAIIPLTTSIQSDRLERRQTAAGIYVFADVLTPYLPMSFTYGATTTNGWDSNRVQVLQRERNRIQSRIMQQQSDQDGGR